MDHINCNFKNRTNTLILRKHFTFNGLAINEQQYRNKKVHCLNVLTNFHHFVVTKFFKLEK